MTEQKQKPYLDQTPEERLKEYEELPAMGGDPQNTGGSVDLMINRVESMAGSGEFFSVLNAELAD